MSLALYRRYRPESFAEVIGQEHVTGPLQQALRNDRVHHAYLFSGPRGCGKTTSARILARALNCEKGPTPEPCGVCDSCVALARGGPGSLDVIEIDAASHGGVDDARDLRERAFFAPASSRFKIYIVDEAHMVTTQGFNALLKLVEEPPEHVKFIFATTEPEKVIGTIRSRTHHYPFRLVPPGTLTAYLADLCAREGIHVAAAVLPLVVRAGGGSVRDALSVLDQLLSGASDDGVTYAMATALLGYTDSALLDAVIDAFAASDGAAAFELVDRVVEAGHDPRRFVADLLDRLRDLLLVDAVPDAVDKGLVVGPPEEVAGLPAQAARFGRSELIRAAEILNVGLTEMRGATAPRLQLELICARVLLPGATVDEVGLGARVDRLERRLAIAPSDAPGVSPAAGAADPPSMGTPTAGAATPAPAVVDRTSRTPVQPVAPPSRAELPAEQPPVARPRAEPAAAEPSPAESRAPSSAPPSPAAELARDERSASRVDSDRGAAAVRAAAPVAESAPPQQSTPPARGGLDIIEVRRQWPAVLDAVKAASKVTWMMLFEKVTVASFDADRLVIAFPDGGTLKGFMAGGRDTVLRDAVNEVLGLRPVVDGILDPSRAPTSGTGPAGTPAPRDADEPTTVEPTGELSTASSRPAGSRGGGSSAPADDTGGRPTEARRMPRPRRESTGARRPAPAPEQSDPGVAAGAAGAAVAIAPDVPDPDSDPDAEESGESAADLLARTLGAVVVDRVSDA